MENGVRTQGMRTKHVLGCQDTFRRITRRAARRGMKVNSSKTAMLCISDTMSYEAKAFIEDEEGQSIATGDTMKVLGFHFSRRPTMHGHVDAIRKRFRRKYWSLYHSRNAGFTEDELAKVYRTVILSVADYCSVVYHSMITDEQDQILERLQSQALKIIYGPGIPYAKMREAAGVNTLRQRRIEVADKFASKCASSGRFSRWFPLRQQGRAGNRATGEKYREDYARCDRLKNSPLFHMRRRLNGKEGRKYGERNKKYRDT